MSSNFKDDPKVKRKFGFALIAIGVTLVVSMFFSWVNVTAIFDQSKFRGTITFGTNGLGMGEFFVDLVVRTSSGGASLVSTQQIFLPAYLIFSVPLCIAAIINIGMGLQLSVDKVTLPRQAGEFIEENWSLLLLMNVIIVLASIIGFGAFYLALPFGSTTPASLKSQFHNLVYFSALIKELTQATRFPATFSIGPGIGYYLATAAGIAITYLYYIYYQFKRDWPKVWKIRGILLPILLLAPLFPVMNIVSPSQVSLKLGLFIPLSGFSFGGAVYLAVVLSLFIIIKYSADTSIKLNQLVQKSYARTDLTDEEIDELMSAVKAQRKKLNILRSLQLPIAIILLVLSFFLLQNLMALNISFRTRLPSGGILSTSTAYWAGWFFWMGPLGFMIIIAVFRH